MEKVNIRNALEMVRFHASVLVRGFARTIYGAMIAILIGASIYGFISIGSETGYIAVVDFIVSVATLAFALINMYYIGQKKRGAKK
jgi:hypothetical protein